MAKFKYKLQSVLEIKEKLESQEKIAYGLATAKVLEEQEKLHGLMLQKAEYDKRARDLVKGDIDLLEIKFCRNAVDTMKARIRGQMIELHRAQKQQELARQRLNNVMIERKTYEKLREKKMDEFKQELLLEEKKEIDEMVSYNFNQEEEQV
ncbi:MAG: flagellar export protein FliJ [Lachnospiraceae bacterium]|nr:flagellar export protein FliJ [Lachnospiraceae bacterium]